MGYLVLLKFLSKNFWIWEEGYTYITRKFDCATKTHSGEGVAEAHSPAAQGVIYGSGGSSFFQATLKHLARLMVAILHGVGGG